MRNSNETEKAKTEIREASVRHAVSVSPHHLVEAVAAVGYQATLASPGPHAPVRLSFGDTMEAIASRKSRFVAGAVFTLLILLINQLHNDLSKTLLLFLLATPVQITVGWDYYRGCIHALRRRKFNLDSLVVLDYDSDSKRPFETSTLTMKTPKGYQYWCEGPMPKAFDSSRLKEKGFDTPRSGAMYSLVPLSRTCVNDHGVTDNCYKHDFRYREWVSQEIDPQPIRKILRELGI
jgi:hypothetical protein